MSRSSLLLIAFLPLLLAANIAINDVPIKLQEQQNQIILTTNITANATTNATKADAALLNVPGSADIRLQLQPEGLSDGSECEGRKCPTNAAVETLVTEQARQLNNTWDVLVKQPLERAKDGLLRGLQDAWSSLKNGFENAGGNLQNATSSVGSAAQSVGSSISNAAKSVGQGFKDAAGAVKDFFSGIFG